MNVMYAIYRVLLNFYNFVIFLYRYHICLLLDLLLFQLIV